MKLTKQQIYIIAGVVLLVIALVIIRARIKKAREEKELTVDGVAEDVTQTDTFPLKKGKRGKRVEQLQMYLIRKYGASFPQFGVDGIWGNETEMMVQKHLKRDNVSEDLWSKLTVDDKHISTFVTNKFR